MSSHEPHHLKKADKSKWRPGRSTTRSRSARWLIAGLLLLAAVGLSACDTAGTPKPRHAKVEVTTVGGPLDQNGQPYPHALELEVVDEHGRTVTFNDELLADSRGSRTSVSLLPEAPGVTIGLRIGHDFELKVRGSDAAGNQLTFGEASLTTSAAPAAVLIELRSLLGSGRLVPRLPVTQLVPGQTIDLLHTASPNERPDLSIAYHELEVTYGGNAEVLSASPRGVRVKVGNRLDGDVVVEAHAEGLVLSSDGVQPGRITSTFTRPFISGVNADVTAPIVEDLQFFEHDARLSGVAYDDQSLSRLDVYDGPLLLATTDPEQADRHGAQVVAFPEGTTYFEAPLALPPGEYELTILATDLAGNQAAATFVTRR